MWDYPRGSVAYDVKVAAILAFIFLTPPSFFRDQPQLKRTQDSVVILPSTPSETRFWLEESLVEGIPADQRMEQIGTMLSERTGVSRHAVSLEVLHSATDEVKGYVAVTRP